jgi:superfamily II DNA or RNA helicase
MRAFCAARPPRRGSIVGATYAVPVGALSERELSDERERLTLQARSSFGTPPPPFCAWSVDAGVLHVPRFYGLERFGPAETDQRVDGEEAPGLVFVGTPTEVQTRATAAVLARPYAEGGPRGAIIVLPCGYGKTCWAIAFSARFRRKTCVLVHKGVLRDQWKASYERFCPGVKVGFVQGDTFDVAGCDVVIAMVLTLAKREYAPLDVFGLVIVDEAHHMAAPVMNLAMRHFRARNVIGLTATKERADGLTPLLHWTLGPEGFRTERDSEPVSVSVAVFQGGCRDVLSRDGKPVVALMTNMLAKHAGRNAFLARRVAAYRARGRVIMVLSDRIEQLRTLRTLLRELHKLDEDEVGLFVGATKEAQRAAELAKPIVLCSYAMANEGIDKTELDTCVMATPKGRVTQCIGRCQRPCATKQPPLVLDVVDDASVYQALRWTRHRYYTKEKYEVQTLQVAEAVDDAWWV